MSENTYDKVDMVRRQSVILAGPIKLASYQVRDPETLEFSKLQFHMTYDNTVMAVMGEEAAKCFCNFVQSTLSRHAAIQVRGDITQQMIADWMVTVIEGGSNYWCHSVLASGDVSMYKAPWYSDPQFWHPTLKLKVIDEEDDDSVKTITWADFQQGTQLLLEKYPMVYGRMMSDCQWDAQDADTWFQLVVFKDVVYG